ncbi:MAG: hypothetical protein ABR981_01075, partial [Candidatus Micrarchaeaceae archaeon]
KLIALGIVSNTPAAPNGLTKYLVINITSTNLTNATTLNVVEKFQCSLTNVEPYILENGIWKAITPYSINAKACTVSFSIPADPIVALMVPSQPQQQKPAASTTIAPVIIESSSSKKASSYNNYLIPVAAVVIIAALIGIGLYGRKGNNKNKAVVKKILARRSQQSKKGTGWPKL